MTILFLRRRGVGVNIDRAFAHITEGRVRTVIGDAIEDVAPDGVECIIRWGTTTRIPRHLMNVPVVNATGPIREANAKGNFRRNFQNEYPDFATPSFGGDWGVPRFPCVVRPPTHAQGNNLHICFNMDEMLAAQRQCGDGWYGAEFIRKTAEYRVFVVGSRAAAVATKVVENPEEVAWNYAAGQCEYNNVRWDDWPLEVVKAAIRANDFLGLSFSGVDVMVDGEGRPYVLEVNSAPSLPFMDYDQDATEHRRNSAEDIADRITYRQRTFVKCMMHHIGGNFMGWYIEDVNNWRDVIHPALTEGNRQENQARVYFSDEGQAELYDETTIAA